MHKTTNFDHFLALIELLNAQFSLDCHPEPIRLLLVDSICIDTVKTINVFDLISKLSDHRLVDIDA